MLGILEALCLIKRCGVYELKCLSWSSKIITLAVTISLIRLDEFIVMPRFELLLFWLYDNLILRLCLALKTVAHLLFCILL